MTKNGIDVSEHQGNIAWHEVKDKIDFAIIRAGYGRLTTQIDKYFQSNYDRATAQSIPVGAYWYSYAISEDEARLEAMACLEIIKGKKFEYPIFFDVEEQKVLALGRGKVSAIISAFCEELEKAGYFVGVYMSAYPLQNVTTDYIKNRYAVWVAHYGVSQPSYSGRYQMWQKSSTGKIGGIAGNVDIDECYVDYPAIIKEAEKNGYVKRKQAKITIEIEDHIYSGLLDEQL